MIDSSTWRPNASINIIQKRAELYRQIRSFMQDREIIEVDTPILGNHTVTDPYIQSLAVNSNDQHLYLHTSPEYCMKRLLAAGTGSIYQIAHVFRDDEQGKKHTMEFCMLEWYRINFDYYQLMDELIELMNFIGLDTPKKMTYAETFEQTLKIDPHIVNQEQLKKLASQYGWQTDSEDQHELLDFLFSAVVVKDKNLPQILIIYDYPECMAALATLKKKNPVVSERFELFINGMEIANGFNELIDPKEQMQRFEFDLGVRKEKGMHIPPIDHNFLAALESGLPRSAGIAVGLDRLLMILTGKDDINEINAFTIFNN
ncbi:MAG: EF-P lysine aminoacylase GenX [Proteobacteria bacterium]|nr:EF-P lysine aminoacylase GenX [Pseudomonadota bacterium]